MRCVIQRVNQASVTVEGKLIGSIDKGILVYFGVQKGDVEEQMRWLCDKMVKLRMFRDENDKMNLSLSDVHGIEKEYLVQTDLDLRRSDLEEARKGVYIDKDRPYKIKSYELINKKVVKIILTEGKNRELRKLFSYFGYEVKQLQRTRIGTIELGEMKMGAYRRLEPKEIESLLSCGEETTCSSIRSALLMMYQTCLVVPMRHLLSRRLIILHTKEVPFQAMWSVPSIQQIVRAIRSNIRYMLSTPME